MIPSGTIVSYTLFGSMQLYGCVLGEENSEGKQLVRMDAGTYDPDQYPDGLRWISKDHLRVIK